MSSKRGFSIIDVIVGVALMLTIFLALFGLLRSSLLLSAVVKANATATEIASAHMEYMHGISYDALGTVGGIPSGVIPQYATTTVDGVDYVTRTLILYQDDVADGTGASDSNNVTTDYKLVKTVVSYTVYGLTKSIALISNFVPQGIESSTGGGRLALSIVDALGAGLTGATVHIVNDDTSPTIDFTTFSNSTGSVVIDGAATSSEYQIYVSRTGYSGAQTYERNATNANPNPGYLTVVEDQTTSETFAIDLLASLSLETFSPAETVSFNDTFDASGGVDTFNNTEIASGDIVLATDEFSGSARSIAVAPSDLTGWGTIEASLITQPNTTALVRVADGSGTPLSDAVLPGNSVGFTTFPVFLNDIATTTYPSLSLIVDLSRVATSSSVSISEWSLGYTTAPDQLPNIGFTLTGTKTIGTDAIGTPLFKTIVSDTTGASGQKTESLEWDAYSLNLPSSNLIESCPAAPYSLAPAGNLTAALMVGAPSTHTLALTTEDNASTPVGGALVVLTSADYAATVYSSACGLAYFNNLASGTYTATVSAPGYTTTTLGAIVVAGNTTAISTFP